MLYVYIYIRVCVCIGFLAWIDARVSVRIKLSRLSTRCSGFWCYRVSKSGGVSRFRNAWLICALTSSGSPIDATRKQFTLGWRRYSDLQFRSDFIQNLRRHIIPFRICIAIFLVAVGRGQCFSIVICHWWRWWGIEVLICKKKGQSLDGNVDYNIVIKYSFLWYIMKYLCGKIIISLLTLETINRFVWIYRICITNLLILIILKDWMKS